jgi:xylan 1,4-beta-xylosidase
MLQARFSPALLLIAAWLACLANGASYVNPVVHGDFPDPGVTFDTRTNRYWLASTSGDSPNHFPIFSSPNLYNWTAQGHVFPEGSKGTPTWAEADFWAPEPHFVNNRWLVYFVARNHKGMLSVGVAISQGGVDGPYADLGSELVTTDNMGMIDPTFYRDNNTNYLIWKEDSNDPAHCPSRNCPTRIFLSPLDASGTKVMLPREKWVVLLQQTQAWEGPLVEAPWIIHNNATGFYYLFYAGSAYNNDKYAVGVARARALLGPWVKYDSNPILHTGTSVFYGPGHCSVVDVIATEATGENGREMQDSKSASLNADTPSHRHHHTERTTRAHGERAAAAPSQRWAVVHHAWNPDNTGRNVLMYALAWGSDGWPLTSTPQVGPLPAPTP